MVLDEFAKYADLTAKIPWADVMLRYCALILGRYARAEGKRSDTKILFRKEMTWIDAVLLQSYSCSGITRPEKAANRCYLPDTHVVEHESCKACKKIERHARRNLARHAQSLQSMQEDFTAMHKACKA
jgi:hypothetical protein